MTVVERKLKDGSWHRISGLTFRKRINALKCIGRLQTYTGNTDGWRLRTVRAVR